MTASAETRLGSDPKKTLLLPRPVPAQGDVGPEEGEIRNGLEEVFSDISEEELESAYGRSPLKKEGGGVSSSGGMLEGKDVRTVSPAGSDLSAISSSVKEEEEEVDEDILYLRLMALRSMIPSGETRSEEEPKPQSPTQEMVELLNEADAAAEQFNPPLIDIADSDEEKMDIYMKTMTTNLPFMPPIPKIKDEDQSGITNEKSAYEPNLKYLVMKLKRSLAKQNNDVFYSPTQSPVRLSSSPESIPLAPSRSFDETIKLPEEMEERHQQPVDMELGSENEAELQFFKHQKEIPSAPWCNLHVSSFPQYSPGSGILPMHTAPPQLFYNCDHYLYQENLYQGQCRAAPKIETTNSVLKSVILEPPPPPLPPLPSPPLPSPPLPSPPSDVPKPKKRTRKRKPARVAEASSDEEGVLPRPKPKLPSPLTSKSDPIDSEDEEAMRAHLLLTMAAKKKAKLKESKPIEKPKVLKPIMKKVRTTKPLPLNNQLEIPGPNAAIMPFEKLKKHFPNMVRPFIIPLKNSDSDSSEDELSAPLTFKANLDLLMKEARGNATKKKKIPPPKPVRKNPPGSKGSSVRPTLQRKRRISLIEKESLKTNSNIKHLPPERQKEYKMLLARIASREKKQLLEKPSAENPVEMRKKLLSKVKNLKDKIDQNKSTLNLKKKVLVEAKENDEPLKNSAPAEPPSDKDERVISSEKEVLNARNEVMSDLFKLSAQLSQFRSESEKLKTAQNFLSDLAKQMEETHRLIRKKEERIAQLRNVVKASHNAITQKRKELMVKENLCQKLGESIQGELYATPQDGSLQIKQKLVQIASNAKLCKQANSDYKKNEEDHSDAKEEISGVNSSLAHLKPGNNNINPHQELCRFELFGKCNDDSCPYQHHKVAS